MKPRITAALAWALFSSIVGFQLRADSPELFGGEYVILPGDYGGSVGERLQQLGFEIVSLDLATGIAFVQFDYDRVLIVDRNEGTFTIVHNDDTVATGSVAVQTEEALQVDATYASDGYQHRFIGTVEQASSNGVVLFEGDLDGGIISMPIDLAALTTGAEVEASRAPDDPGGYGRLPTCERGWLVVISAVVILVLVALLCVAAIKEYRVLKGEVRDLQAKEKLRAGAAANPLAE